MEARANVAGELIAIKNNPELWQELETRGISQGDAAAYILDPDRAMPQIERKIGASKIGAAMQPTPERGSKVWGEQYHPFASAVTVGKLLKLDSNQIKLEKKKRTKSNCNLIWLRCEQGAMHYTRAFPPK